MPKLDHFEKGVALVGGTGIAILIGSMIFIACSQTPEELEKSTKAELFEDIIIVSPREGVECYVLMGSTNSRPRTMSCVTLPDNEEEAQDF